MTKKTNINFPLVSNYLPLELIHTEVVSLGKQARIKAACLFCFK